MATPSDPLATTAFPPWPIDSSLGHRFAAQAAQQRDRPAVIEPDRVTSYAELTARCGRPGGWGCYVAGPWPP